MFRRIKEILSLNEMLVKGSGNVLIAFQDSIYLFGGTSDWESPLKDEMMEKLEEYLPSTFGYMDELVEAEDSDEFKEKIRDHELDLYILMGLIDGRELEISNEYFSHGKGSILLKKVARQLKLDISQPFDSNHTISNKLRQLSLRGEIPNDEFYHGTASEHIESILRFGLRPSPEKTNYKSIIHENLIFFSTNFLVAENHAVYTRHNTGGNEFGNNFAIIVEFRVPDKDKLVPDYDLMSIAVNGKSSNDFKYDYDEWVGYGNSIDFKDVKKARSMMRDMGVYGYRGRIPASFIDKIHVQTEEDGDWEEYSVDYYRESFMDYYDEGEEEEEEEEDYYNDEEEEEKD